MDHRDAIATILRRKDLGKYVDSRVNDAGDWVVTYRDYKGKLQRIVLDDSEVLSASGAHEGCSHTHPPEVPSAPCPTSLAAAEESKKIGYEVAYLTSGARRTHLVSDSSDGTFVLERAISLMRGLKRQGMTAWIEDANYNFVPVPGSMKRPAYIDEHGKTVKHSHAMEASESFPIVERDAPAVQKGRHHATLANARAVYDYVSVHTEKLSQEVVLVCPVDLRRKPLSPKPFMVAMGQRDRVQVDESDALRPVGDTNAAGVIFCHNHPSGDANPSKKDGTLTKQLKKSLANAYPSVTFIDHVVIGHGQFYSFAEEKLYKV